MNRNAFFVASCLSNNAALMAGGLTFPIQPKTSTGSTGIARTYRRGGFLSDDDCPRGTIRISMASGVESDSNDGVGDGNHDDDDDDYDDDDDAIGRMFQRRISPRRQQSQQDYIIGEFDDETIDWESLDIDEMDDFFDSIDYPGDEYVDIDGDDGDLLQGFDRETLLEILGLEDDGETITISDDDGRTETENFSDWHMLASSSDRTVRKGRRANTGITRGFDDLERALMRGVVPADAGVGSGILPGDCGFDPMGFSTRDYFKWTQNFILNLLPERKGGDEDDPPPNGDDGSATPAVAGFANGDEERPPALILRDYREAEIRHGRLAMLAASIWPLQEILDRIFIPDSFGSMTIIYGGGPTLPFLPLIMMFAMLNLGYLDIYSSEIKENESGDAFLPGECFWDPLCILEGAPDTMKRNMQEREILNGRAAMIAVAAYAFEEAMTHVPIVGLPTNALLFEPAYQVPFIQQWLDMQFGNIDYSVYIDPGL
ncbi:hypothetical protein ACHAXA_005708 [Cyclostephanos tholiformis]|uniref:Uncharacterized protein n=1 Tax=Cyclostephanos tholiformis TaxID=382380 RepID=A0ABD3SQI6_9STRA